MSASCLWPGFPCLEAAFRSVASSCPVPDRSQLHRASKLPWELLCNPGLAHPELGSLLCQAMQVPGAVNMAVPGHPSGPASLGEALCASPGAEGEEGEGQALRSLQAHGWSPGGLGGAQQLWSQLQWEKTSPPLAGAGWGQRPQSELEPPRCRVQETVTKEGHSARGGGAPRLCAPAVPSPHSSWDPP